MSAAAYRSGERIRDERSGRTYDHTDRRDVLYKDIVVPSDYGAAQMSWAAQRSELWNAAERAETRANARVAREYLVALPAELDAKQRVELARGFSQELSDRYRFAVDLTVHAPRDYPGSDPRNFHAHLLATTREATADGLTTKTTLEWNDHRRQSVGMQPGVYELLYVRERWASVANEALRAANIDTRIDHRSLAAQGIDREPYPYIPRAAFEMERQGYRSFLAERLRADYEERVLAREARAQAEGALKVPSTDREPGLTRSGPQSLEEVQRMARENWLKYKAASAERNSSAADRSREDDLSL